MSRTRSTRRWLGVIVALQAFTLLMVCGSGPVVSPARAQGVADAGAQREQILDQLKAVNTRLDRLITLLADGKVEVTLRKTDDAGRNR